MRWANIGVLLALVAPLTAGGQGPSAQTSPNANAAPVYITRQRAFSFPVTLPSAQVLGAEPAVFELYYSTDRGANWVKYDARNLRTARQTTPDGALAPFVVQTERDGEYYFASRILDALNRPLYQPQQLPEQRVIVDTVPPRLEFAATAGLSGEVQGQWRVFDEFLKPDTLTLEYQPAPHQPWLPLAFERPPPTSAESSLAGVATWFPQTREPVVSLRATVYDWAGNSTVVTRTVAFRAPESGDARAERRTGEIYSASPPLPSYPDASQPAPVEPIPTYPTTDAAGWGTVGAPLHPRPDGSAPVAATPTGASSVPSPAPPASTPIPWPDDRPAAPRTPALANEYPYRRADTFTTGQVNAPPLLNEEAAPRGATGPAAPAATNGTGASQAPPVLAASTSDVAPRRLLPSPAPPIGPQSLPTGERPRMTNAKKFNLEYDVSSVGPQGVAKVELWITRDGGQSWQPWASDPDRQSPMEVSLGEEGVFGFRVVVTGRNGLTGPIPTAGELADVWIGIDTTAPVARLTHAKYGVGAQAGHLDIRWEADDVLLAARPVTLLFSESAQGPWTIVATGLPNTGNYQWPVDPRTPKSIYLRLEVRDEAGNLGVDQLREPIGLEGLQPKARVRGIQPLEGVGFQPRPSVLFR